MWILIFIIFHESGVGGTESQTSVVAEFNTKQRCENAAAELYRQKERHFNILWTCSQK